MLMLMKRKLKNDSSEICIFTIEEGQKCLKN